MTNNKNTSNNNNDDAESQIPKTCVSEDEQSKNGNRRKTFAGHIRSPRRTMIYVLLTWLIVTIVLSVVAFQKSSDVPQQWIDERVSADI